MTANLFTEISTSKEKNFSCVDLIDTPGLVDGDMQAGGKALLMASLTKLLVKRCRDSCSYHTHTPCNQHACVKVDLFPATQLGMFC